MVDVDAADPSKVHYDGVPVSQGFLMSVSTYRQCL